MNGRNMMPRLCLNRPDLDQRILKNISDFEISCEKGKKHYEALFAEARIGSASIDELLEFYKQHAPFSVSYPKIKWFLEAPRVIFHTWKQNGSIVATIGGMWISICIHGQTLPRFLVSYLCVIPSLRGQGATIFLTACLTIDALKVCKQLDPTWSTAYHTSNHRIPNAFSTTPGSWYYPIRIKELRTVYPTFPNAKPVPASISPVVSCITPEHWITLHHNYHIKYGYQAFFDWTVEEATHFLARSDLIRLTWPDAPESEVTISMQSIYNKFHAASIIVCCWKEIDSIESRLASVAQWVRKHTDAVMLLLNVGIPARLESWIEDTTNIMYHSLVNQLTLPVPTSLNSINTF